MTDEPTGRPNVRSLARQNRLRDALRENLKRRKAQSRSRTDHAGTPGQGACDPGPASSHAHGVEPDET